MRVSFFVIRESKPVEAVVSYDSATCESATQLCQRCRMKRPSSFRRILSSLSNSIPNESLKQVSFVLVILLLGLPCLAQDQPQASQPAPPETVPKVDLPLTVTIPAGARLPLVLTHPIQSRYIHRGDDIYAQVTSPVNSGNQVVIPAGTFVQGTVEKLGRNGSRGELQLQSMSITFPDGYVTPIPGPMTLESNEGYALKDPGRGRMFGALALPAAGAGLGAVIGHSVGASSSTLTSSVPPGCTGPPPGCLSSSMTVPGNAGRNTVIGAGIGAAVGTVASLTLLLRSHHFYLDAGAPLEMTLEQPVTLRQDEVAEAVRRSAQEPVYEQAVAPRPVPPLPASMTVDHGTCYTPGTPGTPPTVIPGAPGPNGVPGPPTVIPGTPPTPGTPYPCP